MSLDFCKESSRTIHSCQLPASSFQFPVLSSESSLPSFLAGQHDVNRCDRVLTLLQRLLGNPPLRPRLSARVGIGVGQEEFHFLTAINDDEVVVHGVRIAIAKVNQKQRSPCQL